MTAPVDAAAALERGRPILIVSPPAPSATECAALWPLVAEDTPVLIITDSPAAARAWSGAVPQTLRFQAVTGLERAARLLQAGAVDVMAGTPADFTALAAKSALKGERIRTVILAWPESLAASGEIAAVLAELRDARRIVLSWDPGTLDAFLEAHARRPHVVGTLPLGENARPLPPAGEARFLITNGNQEAGVATALDALDPASHVVWRRGVTVAEPTGAIICADLPSRAELAALAAWGPVTLLLAPEQVSYARSIAVLRALPGVGAGTAAREARAAVARRIEAGDLAAELALLAPLFERYDAAEVAAAVYAVRREAGSGKGEVAGPDAPRVKVHVNVGKKDRAGAKDIVGALIREAGLTKDDIGRIDVRETFSVVEVAGSAAERAVARLSGMMIRGRRVNARLER